MNHDNFYGLQARVLDLSFPDDWYVPARSRAALLMSPSGTTEIAILELPENHGCSVTNSWPRVAERILAKYLPGVGINDVSWFEVYPYRWRGRENVCRVKIGNGRHQFEYEPDPAVRRRIWIALGLDLEESKRKFPDFGRF